MSHDPLCPVAAGPCCPWMGDCACQCRCEEYAKVREDEQDAQYEAQSENWCKGYAAALRDAVNALKASDPECSGLCDCEAGHVAAIEALAAQTAVAEPDKSPGGAS